MTSAWRSSARLTILVCLLAAASSIAEAQTLPEGWTSGDVGSPAVHGSASFGGDTFSVSGAGKDVWGSADQFHFVRRQLTGDGTIVARVAGLQGTDPWVKAGVMMRESLAAGSRHAFALVSQGKGIAFQRRAATNGSTSSTAAPGAAPSWIKVERKGSSFTASRSSDGSTWIEIASQTISMPATIYVGLAVTSHNPSTLAEALMTDVSVEAVAPPALPQGWSSVDIGAGVLQGSAAHASGVFTIEGAGRDIWGTADELRYTYTQATGDVDIVARVDAIEKVDAWTKAGVMIRGTLSAGSAQAMMLASPGKGLAYQRRPADGAASVHTSGGSGTAPRWVKLSRRGPAITAYQSANGAAWTLVGTENVTLPSTFYVGLAVSSHRAASLATVMFSGVDVKSAAAPNQSPAVSLTSPAAGASLTAPATVAIAASASDADGTIARVDFFSGTTLLGSDATSPYAFTWNDVPVGSHSLTAVAVDNAGAKATSAARSISVAAAPQPPAVSLTAPAPGGSFTAPAAIAIAATASDADGTIARVDFFSGATLLGSDTSSPYSFAWNSVPAGSYSITAVAVDDSGSKTTSAARAIVVTAPPQPPSVSLTAPAAGAPFTAPATVAVAATASDADGTIAKVDFYAGATLLGSDTSAPFTHSWSSVPAGTYSVTAVAIDNAGLETRSAARTVVVDAAPAAPQGLVAHWRFDETAGTAAADAVGGRHGSLVNGAAWTPGRAGGGVKLDGQNDYVSVPNMDVQGNAITLAAWVKSESVGDQRIISKASGVAEQDHYWMLSQSDDRLRFRLKTGSTTLTLVASSVTIPLNTWYHAAATYDGAVMRIYMNGQLVGSAAKTGSLATSAGVPVSIGRNPDGAGYTHHQGILDDVRVYERALSAGEIGDLTSGGVQAPNNPPSVSMTAPASGATMAAPASLTLSASASDSDGSVARVEFYAGAVLLGSDTTSPYSVSWTDVLPGTYSLTAKAWDNAGAWSESAARTVTVTAPTSNQAPYVALTSPVAGAKFGAPASLSLTATATDADGTIARVEFYNGTQLLASDTTAPYSWTWSGVPAGSYAIAAVARDNSGNTTVSGSVSVTVSAPQMPSQAVFTASTNHATAVERYIVEFFYAGTNPAVSNPVSTADVGKPAVVNGEVLADVSEVVSALTPGSYIATVTAMGPGGSARSAPSAEFAR